MSCHQQIRLSFILDEGVDQQEQSNEEEVLSNEQQPLPNSNQQRHQPSETYLVQKLGGQEDVEENQLIQHIQNSPELTGKMEGNTIEKTISSTDENEHLIQANDLQNLQRFEMQGDLERLKEATQNGLREMFHNAVQKQQNFINNVEDGRAEEEDNDSQRFAAIPQDDDDQQPPPGGMVPAMYGPDPEGNGGPFSPLVPESEGGSEEGGRRKSEIMGIVPTSIDDDDNDNDDNSDYDDNIDKDKDSDERLGMLIYHAQ